MTAQSDISTAEIDTSCRLPMFALFGGAAFWLALSSVFGLIATMTFHNPAMFADCAVFSYGRAYPAFSNLLVYGFCIPAGLGVGLWLLARLGRVPIAAPAFVAAAAKLWHVGVLVGFLGILAGDSTGYEWLEMPRYAAVILIIAFLLLALSAFATHRSRVERSLYPSQWFVLASLLWFPWIFSTAILLLELFPVRGVVQASIAWWFAGNLLVVWLGLAGLAAAFYFLPKLNERPLQSHYLALFTFWTLILFGSWVGIPSGAALPAWMPAISAGAKLLMLIPAAAILVSTAQTLRVNALKCAGGPACFVKFGVASLVLSLVMIAATSATEVSRVTGFTWFNTAHTQLRLYGFFAMTMFGAVYYILPRVTGIEWKRPGLVHANFWCGVAGVLLLAIPLAIGGIVQGFKLLDPAVPAVDIARSTLMPLRIASIGEALLLVASLIFLFNVLSLILRCHRAVLVAKFSAANAPAQPSEVRS